MLIVRLGALARGFNQQSTERRHAGTENIAVVYQPDCRFRFHVYGARRYVSARTLTPVDDAVRFQFAECAIDRHGADTQCGAKLAHGR
jgi:hypothetical protein